MQISMMNLGKIKTMIIEYRLAAIKSKDGSQQYKNENTVFGVFCVDLLSRELSKSHYFEFCALVYDVFFRFVLRSRIWCFWKISRGKEKYKIFDLDKHQLRNIFKIRSTILTLQSFRLCSIFSTRCRAFLEDISLAKHR